MVFLVAIGGPMWAAAAAATQMAVTETRDVALIDRVLNDAAVYPWISDDSSPARGTYSCREQLDRFPETVVLAVTLPMGELGGVFGFFPVADGFEMHTSLLANCRGRAAIKAGQLALGVMFRNKACPLVRSFHFDEEPQTGWYARQLGFLPVPQGNTAVHFRGGRPIHRRNIALTRERWASFLLKRPDVRANTP